MFVTYAHARKLDARPASTAGLFRDGQASQLSLFLVLLAALLTGCSNGSNSGVKPGLIVMENSDGLRMTTSALSIGSKLSLSMTASGDTKSAGIDWTVICGGNPVTGSISNGACGTFAATHTANGSQTTFAAPSAVPIGTTVKILATVTSNPAQSAVAQITILPTPVALAFTGSTSTLQVNTASSFSVQVVNDPIGNGVYWTASCDLSACGSFNPVSSSTNPASSVYTAPAVVPASGVVTLTATSLTDTTTSARLPVTITSPPAPPPAPPPVVVSMLTPAIYVQRTGQGRSATLSAVVTNDTANAGVDWTLSCSTTNCGAITAHTASGNPASFTNSSSVLVGGTITIVATSKTDPSKTASSTAAVVTDLPIAVSLSSSLPATMTTGAQVSLVASATPGTAGVNWTIVCGAPGACGGFDIPSAHTANGARITYTAPASVPTGASVSVIANSAATTPSNSAATTTTITQAAPPPPSLSFTSTLPGSLTSTASVPVTAAVANDLNPGGVTWTAQCANTTPGGCGWFAPAQTASSVASVYHAPSVSAVGTSVILTATSVALPTVKLSSGSIPITPDTQLSVQFIPSLPAQMAIDATVNLNAAVRNDAAHAGVDWHVCASGCGFFTLRPAVAAIDATPTSPYVPPVPAVTATAVSGWPSGLPIPYTAPSQINPAGTVAVVASAHANPSVANSGVIALLALPSGAALTGVVQAGSHAIAGSVVSLYAAGNTGYGSASTSIATSGVTDANGIFKIPGGYTCQPEDQMYLVAHGGGVGSKTNSALTFMTALGSCGNLSSTAVMLNEATTVASAFGVAPFAADDAASGNSSSLYIGTSRGNALGLTNAFAAVHNLVDISTGTIRFMVPAENAVVPYVQLNTLADILNACAVTAGGVEGDGSPCGTLLTQTDLLGTGTYPGSIAPADTLQAAFNIAQHPVTNFGYRLDAGISTPRLLTLATASSPFQPILTTQPTDWSLSLHFMSGGGLTSTSVVGSLAIDATGNVWITDTAAGRAIVWNATGAAFSPAAGFPAGGGAIAIDSRNNAWISGDGSLYELTNLGDPLPWSPFGGISGGGADIAIDGMDDIWIARPGGVSEFMNMGLGMGVLNTYPLNGAPNGSAIGIDSANNVWVGGAAGSNGPGYLGILTNPGGQSIVASTPLSVSPQIAADAAGDAWYLAGPQVCEGPPYGGRGSVFTPTCTDTGGISSSNNGIFVVKPQGIAIDGAGTVWIAGAGGTGIAGSIPPGIVPVRADSLVTTSYSSPSLSAGTLRVAIDRSGNIWVLLADNTVTEYVGAATPVVTPLARAVQTHTLGARP